jgi:hypothetical protein
MVPGFLLFIFPSNFEDSLKFASEQMVGKDLTSADSALCQREKTTFL